MSPSKRKTTPKIKKQTGKSSTNPRCTPLSQNSCLQVFPCQLRELWCYDNECGSKYMRGCPLRTCSLLDQYSDSSSSPTSGLSLEKMIIVKSKIEEMWKKAGSLFEVFMLKDEEEKGFRLQVIKDLAMSKVSIKQQDQVHIGWVALVEVTAGQHVFSRSPLAPAGYLGGPASYMNWSTSNKQTANITQSIGKDSSFICYIYTAKPLDAGMELTWDYGCARHMPDYGVWFKDECCRTLNVAPADLRRHELNQKRRSFAYRELCVLCGFSYSIDNQENRITRKKHLANKHADFLGSAWDGTGVYMQQPVTVHTLYQKVDELNHLLTSLKQMRWNVLPACKIFRKREREQFGADVEAQMNEFQRRRDLFKRGGTLVLRGTTVPSSAFELEPITPSRWKVLTWEGNKKPINGRYAVPTRSKDHDSVLNNFVQEFCEKNLNECDVESDSENVQEFCEKNLNE